MTSTGWSIFYYFSGPDFRHNGESITVQGSEVDKYIKAYKNNFERYKSLMESIPPDGDFYTKGECKMNIGVTKYHKGVTISQWYNHLSPSCFPIDSDDKLKQIIGDYEYSKLKAKEIRELVFDNKEDSSNI